MLRICLSWPALPWKWLPLMGITLLLAHGQQASAATKLRVVVRYDDFSSISDVNIDRKFLQTVADLGASTLVGVIPRAGMPYTAVDADDTPVPTNLPKEKIDLLRNMVSEGAIEIALHGLNHNDNSGQRTPSEFAGLPVNRQMRMLADGKRSLENALGSPIHVFVPPFNTYDRDTLRALARTGFELLSAGADGPVMAGAGLAYLPAGPHPDKVDSAIQQTANNQYQHAVLVISAHAFDFSDSRQIMPAFRKERHQMNMDAFFSELYRLKSEGIVEFTTVEALLKAGEDLSAARLQANQRLKHSFVSEHRVLPAAFDFYPIDGLYYSQRAANKMYWQQIGCAIVLYAGLLFISMAMTRVTMRHLMGRHPVLDDLLVISTVAAPLMVLLAIANTSSNTGFYLFSMAGGVISIGILLVMARHHRADVYGRFFNHGLGIMKYLSLPFRYKIWSPRHIRLIIADLAHPAAQEQQPDAAHLAGAIDWLCRAQDVRNGKPDAGGVAAGWSFEDGWLPSYPETTGYIIETFFAAAKVLERPELVQRAERMIDWELSLQLQNGAFPGHFGEPGSHPVIFNQGQIMHGMLAGYVQLGRQDCLEAAVRGGHWMVAQQDEDGCWRSFEHYDTPHVYNTRATWALLQTGLVANDRMLVDAARRNLDWALSQQTASGWYATNAFVPWRSPFTHTIAYAIRGFLESGVLLGEQRYIDSAVEAGRALARVQRQDGWLAGTYKDGWVANAGYACLTGIAQMSLNWIRMAQVTGDESFRENARAALAYLKTTQRLADPDDAVRGGIAGSSPIWGDYSRFEYPNWAAKFFADALMMDMEDIAVPPVPAIGNTGTGTS